MKTIEELQEDLRQAIIDCERYARPAHMVRNCPSDLQNKTQAWRHRQNLEYQIRCLENNEKIY
jgi:hypothetical protein